MSQSIEQPLSIKYSNLQKDIENLNSLPIRKDSEEYSAKFKSVYQNALSIQNKITQLNLYSSNETVDEIQTNYLQYLAIDFIIAKLFENGGGITERLKNLRISNLSYIKFLNHCDDFELLNSKQSRLMENLNDELSLDSFESGSGSKNAVNRREFKIENYKMEKQLTSNLKQLKRDDNDDLTGLDDEVVRQIYLDQLKLDILKSIQSLESNLMEIQMLKSMPPRPTIPLKHQPEPSDDREKEKMNIFTDKFTTKLEFNPNNKDNKNSLVSKEGKVLKPFTIVSSRQQLQNKVQGTGQYLPTMTVEELVDQELKNGGMVKPQAPEPEIDEDNEELADQETYKKREWDLFTEANPRGSGNTGANLG